MATSSQNKPVKLGGRNHQMVVLGPHASNPSALANQMYGKSMGSESKRDFWNWTQSFWMWREGWAGREQWFSHLFSLKGFGKHPYTWWQQKHGAHREAEWSPHAGRNGCIQTRRRKDRLSIKSGQQIEGWGGKVRFMPPTKMYSRRIKELK